VILVDEPLALLAAAGRPHAAFAGDVPALSYGRAYRLIRALLDPGPGRLAIRGRFSRLAEGLSAADRAALHARLADSSVIEVVDPRPLIRAAGAIQNTYSVSLLQAETLAAAAMHDWPIIFAAADSASASFRQAVTEIGLTLRVLGTQL
jgi:hypothetical protein